MGFASAGNIFVNEQAISFNFVDPILTAGQLWCKGMATKFTGLVIQRRTTVGAMFQGRIQGQGSTTATGAWG